MLLQEARDCCNTGTLCAHGIASASPSSPLLKIAGTADVAPFGCLGLGPCLPTCYMWLCVSARMVPLSSPPLSPSFPPFVVTSSHANSAPSCCRCRRRRRRPFPSWIFASVGLVRSYPPLLLLQRSRESPTVCPGFAYT